MSAHIKNRADWDGRNKLADVQYELQLIENRCVDIMNVVKDVETLIGKKRATRPLSTFTIIKKVGKRPATT